MMRNFRLLVLLNVLFLLSACSHNAIADRNLATQNKTQCKITVQKKDDLLDWQKRVLVWHSGQMSAMLGEYKTTDQFLWNPYVETTSAFLKKDKPTPLTAQKKLTGGGPDNQINLRIVNSFVRCFNSSYSEAYSQNCKGV